MERRLPVLIDIKPGSDANPINPFGIGVTPLAGHRRETAMKRILTLIALVLAAPAAHAQETCRAADVNNDGVVGTPDFTAVTQCWGQPVTAPLPSGEYVGFFPITPGTNAPSGIVACDQACRDNFGPTAHWCTSLEISQIDDLNALPEGVLHVRPTPPVSADPSGRDWVTGKFWNVCDGQAEMMSIVRQGSDAYFGGCTTVNRLGLACCMEPTP